VRFQLVVLGELKIMDEGYQRRVDEGGGYMRQQFCESRTGKSQVHLGITCRSSDIVLINNGHREDGRLQTSSGRVAWC